MIKLMGVCVLLACIVAPTLTLDPPISSQCCLYHVGECSRAQRLAAEVVDLEERVLRARSNELRREREVAAEREAAKRAQRTAQTALLEKSNLQAIIETLQVADASLPQPTIQTLSFARQPLL
jgi:hypothetical protein